MSLASELKAANRAAILDNDAFGSNHPSDIVKRLDVLIDNIFNVVGPSPNIKISTGLLTQTGVLNPSESVLNNSYDTGTDWARTGVGVYTGTQIEGFELASAIFVGSLNAPGFVRAYRSSANVITVETFDAAGNPADGLLENTALEIKSYLIN